MRMLCIVLDSVGCGNAPDAADFGDAGANTLGHLFEKIPGFTLPNLASLGLHEILGIDRPAPLLPNASFARLTELSAGKDTTTGHWELMGCQLEKPFATFTEFPPEIVAGIEAHGGVRFLGNVSASGTEILSRLGEVHLATGRPILYTSADSVLQIAAHEQIFGLEKLWQLCQTARRFLDENQIPIGRVIARPFLGDSAENFQRTANRHDYSLTPPPNLLHRLQDAGVQTIGVGKISDIFADSGISESHPSRSNAHGMEIIENLWAENRRAPHFMFANLVDFDSLYGHRRNPQGYAACLQEFDRWLGGFLPKIRPDDFVVFTADHGNDPFHPGTDHTREQVPVLALNAPTPFTDGIFADLSKSIEEYFIRATQ